MERQQLNNSHIAHNLHWSADSAASRRIDSQGAGLGIDDAILPVQVLLIHDDRLYSGAGIVCLRDIELADTFHGIAIVLDKQLVVSKPYGGIGGAV